MIFRVDLFLLKFLEVHILRKKEVSHITLVDIFLHVHYNKHKKNTLGIPNGLIQHMNEAQSGCVHEQVAKADCECPLCQETKDGGQ